MRFTVALLTSLCFLLPATVLANNPPIADAGPNQDAIIGEPVILYGTASDPDGDPIVSWSWALDAAPEGASFVIVNDDQPNVLLEAYTEGYYVLKLIVSDGTDDSMPATVFVHVHPNLPPTAIAGADVTIGEFPLEVHFDGFQSTDPEARELTYLWTFGDGSYSTEMSPTHVFLAPGTYTVALKVTDDREQIDSDTITIEVTFPENHPPIADAGPDQDAIIGEPVILYGTASDPDGDPIVSWSWSLEAAPEGAAYSIAFENQPNVLMHAYTEGYYVLELIVTDGTDDSVPDTAVVHIHPNLPPTAIAVADVATGEAPLEVHFDGSQSTDPEGGELTYLWSFGDFNSSTEMSATHAFVTPGTYIVELKVTDDHQQFDTDLIIIGVTYPQNRPPVAVALVNGQEGVTVEQETWEGTTVLLDGSQSHDPDGDELAYEWDFEGDGEYDATGASQTHTYNLGGPYVATLKVTDPRGVSDTDTVSIIVVDTTAPAIAPPAAIEVAESSPLGTPVDLGEPTVSDDCDPDPTIENDAPALFLLGATTVTWSATDASGNVGAAQQQVAVVPGSPENQLDNEAELIRAGVESGEISCELEESLLAKVNAAMAALVRGNRNSAKVAMNDLKALIHQVEAQTDKKIDAGAAALMIERANDIITALGGEPDTDF